jgi:hypothetical protein
MNSILWKILYYQLARRFAETVSEQPYARQTSPSRRGSSSTLRCGRGGRDGQRRESAERGAGGGGGRDCHPAIRSHGSNMARSRKNCSEKLASERDECISSLFPAIIKVDLGEA